MKYRRNWWANSRV